LTDVFSRLSRGETIRDAPLKFRTKSGEARYVMVDSNVSYHEDGSFKHTRCFIRNDFDRIIGEAVHEATIKQLKSTASAKDNFIRRVFHEIRTPLHTISATLSHGSSVDDLKELDIQVQDCVGIIEDLGFATMVEAGNLLLPQPRFVHLDKLITSVTQFVNDKAKDRMKSLLTVELTFRQDAIKEILIDNCFHRAMYNLLNNCNEIRDENKIVSITFSQSDPSINNSIESESNLYCSISCPICDNVDVSDIYRSFENYYNADLSPRHQSMKNSLTMSIQKELALGWYVSYNIIQNLGGILQCSQKDNVLLFQFNLKVGIPDETNVNQINEDDRLSPKVISALESDIASKHLIVDTDDSINHNLEFKQHTKRRILIVDDSIICQKVMVKLLTTGGFDSDVAFNGQVVYIYMLIYCGVIFIFYLSIVM
jgi:hypothetical protein